MDIKIRDFGLGSNLITLTNQQGVSISFTNFGARIVDWQKDGKRLVLGFDSAQEYLEKCILEPVNDCMSFGEVMALINENSEILVSRKAYDIDYIYFNSETDQFESYTNGIKTLHSFPS